MHATYEETDDRPILRFERQLDHPVDAVWRAVTDPAELAHWFPTHVAVDLRVGGRMTFTFQSGKYPEMEGEVIELDPPHRFVFMWGEDELRFELQPSPGGDGCLLRFAVVLDAPDKAARDAAGWHVCLNELEKLLAGASTTPPSTQPTDDWRAHYEEYARRGLPTGAHIPGETVPSASYRAPPRPSLER
jgi:uncharacterized protein YndB with AHSA1/START domain